MPWRISISCVVMIWPFCSITPLGKSAVEPRIFGDVAQRRAQFGERGGIAEEARKLGVGFLPIRPRTSRRLSTGLRQADRPPPGVALIATKRDQPVAFQRAKALSERRAFRGEDLGQFADRWRL